MFGAQNTKSGANVAAATARDNHPSRHVEVLRDGADTILCAEDGEVHWIADKAHWQLTWRWKDGHPPDAMIGSGVGEYSRKHLTAEQEELFCQEVESWIKNQWLVEHDPAVHGEPGGVLPLLARTQEHKSSMPVHPYVLIIGL